MNKKFSFEKLVTRSIVLILIIFLLSIGYTFIVKKGYSEEKLPNRLNYLEIANGYEHYLGWRVSAIKGNAGIFTWDDGTLAIYEEKCDVTPTANSILDLKSYLDKIGINMLYVQAGNKVSESEDSQISGSLDFSNQNITELLGVLKDNGITCMDMRDYMLSYEKSNNTSHHELYYRTDNHWKGETGFWASGIIGDFVKENYRLPLDTSVFDKSKYEFKTLKNWWIGAQGKKVTLAKTNPEDFTLIYPEFENNLSISVPYKNVYKTGDFSVTYNNSLVYPKDYYKKYTYLSYGYGCQPTITIKNNLATNDTHILVIKDSFADSVYPFLALSVAQVDIIDPRYYFFDKDNNISIKEYIKQLNPDLVIMLYSPLVTYFPNCTYFDEEIK